MSAKAKIITLFKEFIKDYKEGRARMPVALIAIRFLEEHRRMKRTSMSVGANQGSPAEIQR